MKKTAQFGLNQWEMSDRIQMQDFNRDNAAIEAALGTRNCQFYTASYTGDGEATKSWTFPAKPVLVVIIGQVITVLIRDFSIGITQFGSSTHQLQATWEENSVTWVNTNNSGIISANGKANYGIFAILEAE
jgi:hypothetical protein